MNIIAILLSLFGLGSQAHATDLIENHDELWVMVKTDEYFRGQNDMQLMEEITNLIEPSGLGILDGHSSGAYQFEFNYFEVSGYDQVKSIVERYINSKYPDLTYTISNDYEMPYEKL